MTIQNKQKPVIVAMSEAENELIKTVNDIMDRYNLPCYLFEILIDKVHRQLTTNGANEVIIAKEEYYNSIKPINDVPPEKSEEGTT